jgi:membrane protein
MREFFSNFVKGIVRFFSQESRIFRYSLSYCLILALFPTVIVIFTLFYTGVFDIERIIDPKQIVDIAKSFKLDLFIVPILDTLEKKPMTNIVSSIVTILISCFMASNSLYSFMLVTAQQEKFRTYGILIRIKAVFAFISLIGSILVIATIAYFAPIKIHTLSIIFLFVFLYLFFRTLSFAKRPLTYALPGTFFSAITIVLFSFLFVKILQFFQYGSIYGALASVVGALLAINIISSIIYFGYCLNSVYDENVEIVKYKTMWFYAYGELLLGRIENRVLTKIHKRLRKSIEEDD